MSPSNGSFSTFGTSLATFECSVSAVARREGAVDVFVIEDSSSNNAYHAWHNQSSLMTTYSYSNWRNLGGLCRSTPSVVSWDADRLDIFVWGTDASIWVKSWSLEASWTDWSRILNGQWTGYVPTVVSWGVGRIDLFAVDQITNVLYHAYYDESWKPGRGFESLGGYCASRPIAVSSDLGRLDVFVRGKDSRLWHLSYANSTWSNWQLVSDEVSVQGEPEAVSWGSGHLDVFVWGTDNSLLHKSLDNGQWTPTLDFEVLGSSLGGPPKAVSDGAGSLHVFSFSDGGMLQHNYWNQSIGVWSPSPAGTFDQLGTPP